MCGYMGQIVRGPAQKRSVWGGKCLQKIFVALFIYCDKFLFFIFIFLYFSLL